MRKIYDEYLYVPEQGEGVVREKVFFSRLIISIVCMLICMLAMGYNAYAFFTANVESTSNMLQAATYTFDVEGTLTTAGKGSFSAAVDSKYEYTLNEGMYDFTLTKSNDATAEKGYCRIDVIQGESVVQQFYSQQIGGVFDTDGKEITSRKIRITVDAVTVVRFVECWGTYIGNTEEASDEAISKLIVSNENMIEIKDGVVAVATWADPTDTNPIAVTSVEETTTAAPDTPTTDNEKQEEEEVSSESQ